MLSIAHNVNLSENFNILDIHILGCSLIIYPNSEMYRGKIRVNISLNTFERSLQNHYCKC